MTFEPDGAAEGIDEVGEFDSGILGVRRSGNGLERGRSSYLDRFTGEGAVVRFQRAGLFDEGLPGEGGCPGNGEDIAGEDAGGIHGLAELPIGDGGRATKGIEIGLGAFGGLVVEILDFKNQQSEFVNRQSMVCGLRFD